MRRERQRQCLHHHRCRYRAAPFAAATFALAAASFAAATFALAAATFAAAVTYTAAIATTAHGFRAWHLLQLHRQPV